MTTPSSAEANSLLRSVLLEVVSFHPSIIAFFIYEEPPLLLLSCVNDVKNLAVIFQQCVDTAEFHCRILSSLYYIIIYRPHRILISIYYIIIFRIHLVCHIMYKCISITYILPYGVTHARKTRIRHPPNFLLLHFRDTTVVQWCFLNNIF